MKQLLGVAMCGGQSRRMGTDKGLIMRGGMAWAQIVTSKLSNLQIPVVISINPSQYSNYKQLFDPGSLIMDTLTLQGPLNGLLSVHQARPDADMIVLACDMIDMKVVVLQNLIQRYRNEPGFDYYAYHNDHFFEPLCAIYTCAALKALNLKFDSGGATNFSLQNILINGNTKQLPVDDSESFNNNNEHLTS
ncbi:molybdenum cofactor guanylyltransferase [Mucilaginibacter paludis]|uniref:Molybdenum cofactor guanylyltransferase n=1 Tax=Mucilaginibacter paludis DSM 18603 TaxID=714943 RepID=H1YH93_9SPHI|nr:NTP transferase domain-containing protein [Mucilaginibacter paludis]EHQ24595.1 molybdenum cofactor guanylyltransferase [Mucilaginibacter paludis DSM 18603]